MYKIGLTGGIASGKSTVSQLLQEHGAAIIDADKIAMELEEPGQAAWQEIVATFGREVLLADGALNRKALGNLVFPDPKALARLNKIVHPKVIQYTEAIMADLVNQGVSVAVLDAPLLIEAGMNGLVNEVWIVHVPEEIQIQRLMARNNFSRSEALARINSQMPLRDKLAYADRIIDNSGTFAQTRVQVGHLWQELLHIIALRSRPEG